MLKLNQNHAIVDAEENSYFEWGKIKIKQNTHTIMDI